MLDAAHAGVHDKCQSKEFYQTVTTGQLKPARLNLNIILMISREKTVRGPTSERMTRSAVYCGHKE